MRPQLGRVYSTLRDPAPFADALAVLGFGFFAEPVSIGKSSFLDAEDRTVDLGDQRIQLSPLEFGVLATLSERPGRAVTRAELIDRVWGTTYVGGSDVVDVVVRSLRQKLGPMANRVETARGVGYRLR